MAHLRSIIFVSILAIATGPIPAQGQNLPDKKQVPEPSHPSFGPRHNSELRLLLNDSESLPPEFASDIALTLLENGFVQNKTLRAKLITHAFEKASAAQDDVMRRPFGVSVEETSEGLHAIASTVTSLDRISLQARVVRQVAATDPRMARQLFESMQPPQLTSIPCNEDWFFEPDAYYDALAVVVHGGFSEREIAGGNRAGYISSIMRHTQSHVQLVPLARMLSTEDFTEQELRTMIPVYAATIEDVRGDPLSFSILMSAPDSFFKAITTLLTSLDKRNVESRALLHAFRDYIVTNYKGQNCDATKSNDSKSSLPEAVVQFNKEFQSRLIRMNLTIIGEDEIRNTAKGSTLDEPLPSRWDSLTYFQLLKSVQKLNNSLTQKELAEGRTEKDAIWVTQARDVLDRLNAWSNEGEREIDFFHQKAIFLEALTDKTIGTSLHAEVLDAFIRFLEQNSYQDVSPIDWFFCAKIVLSNDASADGANVDLKRLVDSREPVLSEYAKLQSFLQSAKQTSSGKHPSKVKKNSVN
jgi:hypothetical protein